MNFDSTVTFLFIIAFFVLPTILKQLKGRKKKKTGLKAKKKTGLKAKNKKPSFFNRIGDQIQQFVRELEDQARQQKEAAKDQESAWESLAEDDIRYSGIETVGEDADFNVPKRYVPDKKIESKRPEQPKRRQAQIKDSSRCAMEKSARLSNTYRFKSDPLQNAVVWSEILSKPVALREDNTGG